MAGRHRFRILRSPDRVPVARMPHDLVKWWVAYRWFRTLSKDGTWQRIHDGLHVPVRNLEGRDPGPTACALDSRSAQSAEGGEKISFDKFKHCRGRKST